MAFPQVGVEAVIKGLNDYLGGMEKIDDANQKAGAGAEKSSGLLSKLGGTLLNVGTAVAATAVAGIATIGGAMIKLGADSIPVAKEFQDKMAILSTAAADSGQTFAELQEAAIAVGGDTRILGASASGAADAMTGLYKSGLTTTEIFGDLNSYMDEGAELGGALRAAFDLAAATELDVAQAADLAAVALATFGGEMESEEERAAFINKALNNMVQAADASVAEVSDLAQGLANVGPVAASMGMSIEDTNNVLAILSTRGIAGAEAGTNLKSMLSNMIRPTDSVREALSELNISLYDSNGQFRSFPDILSQFEGALANVTDAERDEYVQTIAGNYGKTAMLALLDEGRAGWDAMALATANAATIQEQAAARGATLSSHLEALEGTIETVKIRIGTALIPVLTELVDKFTGIIEEHGPALVAVFEGIATYASTTLIPAISRVVDWLMKNIPFAIQTAADFWENTLQPALQFVSDFITSAVIPTIERIVQWLQEYIPVAIQLAADYWSNTLQPALSAVQSFIMEKVIPAIENVVGWLMDNIPVAIQLAADFWTKTLQPALSIVQAFIVEKVIPTIENVVGWLMDNIPVAVQLAADFWQTVLLPAISAVSTFINETAIPTIELIVSWLQEYIPIAAQLAADFWETVLLPAIEVVSTFITETAIPTIETVVQWLQEYIPVAIQMAADFWETVLHPALETVATFITETVVPTIETVVQWLQEYIPAAVQIAADFWETTLQPALETVSTFITETVIPAVETVVMWLEKNIPTAIETAREWFEITLQNAIETVSSFINDTLLPAIEDVSTFILDKWGEAVAWVETNWPMIQRDYIEPFVNFIVDTLLPAIEDVASFIMDKWQEAVTWVADNWPRIQSDYIEPVIEYLASEVLATIEDVATFLIEQWSKITVWVEENWPLIQDTIQTVMDFIGKIFTDHGPKNIQVLGAAFLVLQETVDNVWEVIKTAVDVAITAVLGILKTTMQVITGDWEGAWQTIQNAASDIWDEIKDLWERLTGDIQSVLDGAIANLESAWSKVWEKFKTILREKWEEVKNLATEKVEEFVAIFTGIGEKIRLAGEQIVADFLQGIQDAWGGVVEWWSGAVGGLTAMLPKLPNLNPFGGGKSEDTGTANSFREGGSNIVHSVAAGMEAAAPIMLQRMEDMLSDMTEDVDEASEEIRKLMGDSMTRSMDGIGTIIEKGSKELFDPLVYAAEQLDLGDALAGAASGFADLYSTISADGGAISKEISALSKVINKEFIDPDTIQERTAMLAQQSKETLIAIGELNRELRTLQARDIPTERELLRIEEINNQIAALRAEYSSIQYERMRTGWLPGIAAEREELEGETDLLERRLSLQQQLIEQAAKYGIADIFTLRGQDISELDEIDLLEISNELIADRNAELAEQQMTYQEIIAAAREYRLEQQRLERIEERRADIAFLQQQLDLLDLIAEHGLDVTQVLGGMELGLDADINRLLDAMVRAMDKVIATTEDALGIASPAKPFIPMGEQIDAGLAEGIIRGMGGPLSAIALLGGQMASLPTPGLAAAPIIQQGASISMSFGGNTISSDVGLNRFENMVRRVVRQEIGGLQ